MHAGQQVTANIEAKPDGTRRQDLDSAAVVNRELVSDLPKAGPAGAIVSKRKYGTKSCRDIRLRLRQWSLKENIAVVDNGLRVAVNEVGRICNGVLAADNAAVA